MFQLFSRISWLIAIILGISIFSIDNDLFIFAVGATIVTKFFLLSDAYIKQRVTFFADQISVRSPRKNTLKQEKRAETPPTEIPVEDNKRTQEEEEEELPKNIASSTYKEHPKEPREPSVIEKFFAENLLAKVGGILIFLGVLFFLSLIYAIIGPVAKMLIGFVIGFVCYGTGVWLDKKGFTQESRIVMGTGILINYLVILSGRYLLEGDSRSIDLMGSQMQGNILTVGMTFFFLILNTVFAVITALVYNSRPLLLFGFVIAYLNPLLLGESSTEPYTLLGYTMIVTLGAMFMSFTRKDSILFILSFILASVMFLIAPWSDGIGWITKLLCINTLGAIGLYVSTQFQKTHHFIYEILIGGIFFLIGVMGLLGIESLTHIHLMILGASSLLLMGLCYTSMHKGVYLYSIGTLGTILTLSPAVLANGIQEESSMIVSIAIIGIFGIMNLSMVLVKSEKLISGNLGNIISGLISGAIFLTYMIYVFGNEYFPGVMQGFVFLGLAVVYCSVSFLLVQKVGIQTLKDDEKSENTFYAIAAIGVSLFTLAVAFVFAETKEIVSIIWLLEASVLFFVAHKTNSIKVAVGGIILLAIGVMRLLPFLDTQLSGNYGLLVAMIIISISLIGNLFLIYPGYLKKNISFPISFYGVHNLFHIIGIVTITSISFIILDFSNEWTSLLYFSIIVSSLGALYSYISSKGLQAFHLIVYVFLLIVHIGIFSDALGRESMNLSVSTLIAAIYALPYIYEYIRLGDIKNRVLLTVFLCYLFILSTLYVLHIFDVTFAVTIYWGVLASILLGYGINKDILYMRTIGLYLITLTAGKIFLYDIWMSVDDTVSRVVALMVVGILMIVLSTMYTKRFGNNLNSEFSPENLFPKNGNSTPKNSKGENPEKSSVQKDIESIDVSGISGVRLVFNDENKPVQIRAINLIKIATLLKSTYKKEVFEPGELEDAFDMISKNYTSSLSGDQYKKIKDIVEKFVAVGGSIEFVKK